MADISKVPESRQQSIVEAIKKKILSEPSLVAEHIGLPSGVVVRSPKQERVDYWTTNPNVLADPQAFIDQAAQTAMMSAKDTDPPETTIQRASALYIHALYPARLDLIRSGKRALSVKSQIAYSDEMEAQGPPPPEEYE